MNELLHTLAQGDGVSRLGAEAILLYLLIAFLLGQLLAWVYMWTHQGLSYSRSHVQSLVLLSLIVTIVMLAVGNNLVATGSYSAANSDAVGVARDFVLASSDGRTWSTVLSDVGDRAGPLQIVAGPDGFLVIGGALDGGREWTVWRSADGKAWQNVGSHDFSSGSSNEVRIDGLAATSSGFVAVGTERDCFGCRIQSLLWTSPDGRSWRSAA